MTHADLRIEILRDADEVARSAAAEIIAALRYRPDLRLGLATGATMTPLYARLVTAYQLGEVSFRSASSFNLDEYVGVASNSPRSFHAYMHENFFARIDIARGRAHIPDGNALDIQAESHRYETLIHAAGGIDTQLLGIGTNGHIGFNEPGSPFASRTRKVKLEEATRLANADDVTGIVVPEYAITMGIATILEARRILLLATGADKAAAIAAAIEGPLTPACPASALRLHGNVEIICDETAASLLRHSGNGLRRRA